MAFFSYFRLGFRSSHTTADLQTVVHDRITKAFNRSGATRAVALDISEPFDRVWLAGLLQVRYLAVFLLFSVIDGFS